MVLTYKCDDCEDIERMNSVDFFDGMHCECGGHLFLLLQNNYERGCEATKCMTCKHAQINLSKCTDCLFN